MFQPPKFLIGCRGVYFVNSRMNRQVCQIWSRSVQPIGSVPSQIFELLIPIKVKNSIFGPYLVPIGLAVWPLVQTFFVTCTGILFFIPCSFAEESALCVCKVGLDRTAGGRTFIYLEGDSHTYTHKHGAARTYARAYIHTRKQAHTHISTHKQIFTYSIYQLIR